jgi:tight adherence protein C
MTTSATDRRMEVINLLQEAVNAFIASMESDTGFDSAMRRYSEQGNNELSRAFAKAWEEMYAGVKRRVALTALAQQINVPEVTEFTNAMIQAEEENKSALLTLKEQAQKLGRKTVA